MVTLPTADSEAFNKQLLPSTAQATQPTKCLQSDRQTQFDQQRPVAYDVHAALKMPWALMFSRIREFLKVHQMSMFLFTVASERL